MLKDRDESRLREIQLARVLADLTRPGFGRLLNRAFDSIRGVRSAWQVLTPLLGSENLVGFGVSEKRTRGEKTGDLGLTVYVKEKLPADGLPTWELAPRAVVVPDLGFVPIDVVELGKVFLESGELASGGSVRADGGPGTVGAIVHDHGQPSMLSNRHVLAASGSAHGQAVRAPADGDLVGHVSRVVPLRAGKDYVNHADAGIASILAERHDQLSLDAPFGQTNPKVEPHIGMSVAKLGAATGLTESVVVDAHFYVVIDYPGIGPVGFSDQIQCEKFTAPGDSGSMVWDATSGSAVGLHFAGTRDRSIANRIGRVLSSLDVQMIPRS